MDTLQNGLNIKVKKICDTIKPNLELEASFGSNKKPISLKKFHNILKYIRTKGKKDNLKTEISTSLDIIYNYDQKSNSTYRISIYNTTDINNFIQNNSLLNNNTIFSKQVKISINSENKNIVLINKVKSSDKFIALDDYDIRIKVSEENEIEQSILKNLLTLTNNDKHNIIFRYKQRVSLIVYDNTDYTLRIDLTDVKTSKNLGYIINNVSQYELEVDISFKKSVKDNKLTEILDLFGKTIVNLEQFLQESLLLTTNTESINVIKNLNKLAYEDENEVYKDLPGMQSVSLEIQHVLDYIPGNYSITDKADGERYFLMIYENSIYLISNNLEVKKIKTNIKNTTYNLTILDGEYIYIPEYRKFLYITFDILFFQGKDIRTLELLKDRLLLCAKVYKDVFSIDMDIGIYKDTDYDNDKIYKFHTKNINNHLKQLYSSIKNSSETHIINYKYFIFPIIGSDYLIYKLATLMYDIYTSNTENKCIYKLDGMIYTPIKQIYTRNAKDTKYKIYKWKSAEHNSIDFYVKFERNSETNKVYTVYDRTSNNKLEDYVDSVKNSKTIDFTEISDYKVMDSVYQILNLYVGRVKNNIEIPFPFQRDNDLNLAYINLKDGYPLDINGNIIEDSTVVEFAYNNNKDIDDKFRWIPLRTRYDKTESVMRFKRKYGNNFDIANRIWNSIQNPITYDDIKLLGNTDTNENHIKQLKTKITSEIITIARRDDSYYQLVTNIGKPLRNFHNWIKSNIVYTYCSKKVLLNKSIVNMDVLDIGFGRGGELNKYYHAKVKSVVALDVNESSIFSGSDGALSRYNVMKKKMPNYPKMFFLVADAGQKLDYQNQSTVIKSNEQNTKLLKQIFGDSDNTEKYFTFDVISAQFMIHYLLKNENTWNNFIANVNKYLRKDGYLLITTLDGDYVNREFKNNHITKSYISPEGDNKILFDIIKKYNTIDSKLGNQIDVHLPMFMGEGVYQTEYLVFPDFLINELTSKCGMHLIETESFQNLFHIYKDFFLNYSKFESKIETRTFFDSVGTFYNDDILTKDWFEYSKLHRYYIFRKS